MAEAVDNCVHCGFCHSQLHLPGAGRGNGLSPRGRIILMKESLEGRIEAECRAALYRPLLGAWRASRPVHRASPTAACSARSGAGGRSTAMLGEACGCWSKDVALPDRFRLAATAGRLGKLVRAARARRTARDAGTAARRSAAGTAAAGDFSGAGQAPRACRAACRLRTAGPRPQINWATLRVLAQNGIETVIPRGQACCGSLSLHIGEGEQARELARINLGIFPSDIDAIITNAAGCGSGMHEYGLLFAGQMDAERAAAFGNKVRILPFSWTKQASLRRAVCPSRFAWPIMMPVTWPRRR